MAFLLLAMARIDFYFAKQALSPPLPARSMRH
jgi:hypothetical protein